MCSEFLVLLYPAHPHTFPSSSLAGVDSGEMEVQTQGEEEDPESWKDRQYPRDDDERADRSRESTIHTVPDLLLDPMQVSSTIT